MKAILIELLGEKHSVRLPDFAVREELYLAWGETLERPASAQMRAYCAILGLCTRLGDRAKVSYRECRFDPLEYGGKMYSWLVGEKKASPKEITSAAIQIVNLISEGMSPREKEVEEKENFTAPSEGTSTGSASS